MMSEHINIMFKNNSLTAWFCGALHSALQLRRIIYTYSRNSLAERCVEHSKQEHSV